MTKKAYVKPAMRTVELKQRMMILTGSMDANGMSKNLHEDEVEEGW